MDARWRSHDLGEGAGLKGCAARTGRPALALDPPHPHPSVWLTCRFEHGCVRQTEGVMSTLRTE